MHAALRCCALTSREGRTCRAAALSEESRKHYSEVFGFELPDGFCLEHAKQHARRFHGVTPVWNFREVRLCGKLTKGSRYKLPCRLPRMHGLGACHKHGAKGVGPWNSNKYGKLGWEKRRTPDGRIKSIRVKKSEQTSYAHQFLNPQLQPVEQPRATRTLADDFYSRPRRPPPFNPYGS
jgi:hypothetical protein